MRKSIVEKLREARQQSQQSTQVTLNSIDDLYALMLGGPMNPTQRRFIYGRERFRAYKGPAGCAKSSTLCALGFGRALLVPGSRIFVSRYDYNDLLTTTVGDTMEGILGRLPKGTLLDRDKSPPMTWYIKPVTIAANELSDDDVSQFVFMGLKDALGSIQATGWLVDEADEVEEKRIHEIGMRLRKPNVPVEDYFCALAFNPPDKHHWLYSACTGLSHEDRKMKEPWLTLYEPLPRENVHNLPDGYYETNAVGMTEDMKQRLIDGLWGATFDGQPVYREFNRRIHVKKNLLEQFDPTRPVFRFWDFGYRHPCCIYAQVDHRGRLLRYKSVLGENEEIVPFARRIKADCKQVFKGHDNYIDYGDPAAAQKKDTGSTVASLHQEDVKLIYKTSTIDHGLRIERLLLEQMIGGEPASQFDEKGCAVLIQAFAGGYRLDKLGAKPVKDGIYDHPADADRYGVDNLFSGTMAQKTMSHMGAHPTSVEYDPSQDRW